MVQVISLSRITERFACFNLLAPKVSLPESTITGKNVNLKIYSISSRAICTTQIETIAILNCKNTLPPAP